MDMPCNCPECGEVVELSDMMDSSDKLCYHNLVCRECFHELEGDEE